MSEPDLFFARQTIDVFFVRCVVGWRMADAAREDNEVISMKMMEVLLECIRCSAGQLLTNEAVCTVFQACFHLRSYKGTTSKKSVVRIMMVWCSQNAFNMLPHVPQASASLCPDTQKI